MQYPFDGLTCALQNNLMTSEISVLIKNSDYAPDLKQELLKLFEQSRFLTCSYLASALNEQQATYMLHALKVNLFVTEQNLIRYKAFVCLPENNIPAVWCELYDLAIKEVNALSLFLSDYFSTMPDIPLPAFAEHRKKADLILQTNLSVPQLGLFVRLLIETGIIQDGDNISGLMNKIASSLRTRKAQQISSESLRIKYYTPEKAAVSILKDYVAQMMQLLRKY